MVMKPMYRHATAAMGRDRARRLKGPFLKLDGYTRPMRMGRP